MGTQTLDDTAFKFFALVLLLIYLIPSVWYIYYRLTSKTTSASSLARTTAEQQKLQRIERLKAKPSKFTPAFVIHLIVTIAAAVAFVVVCVQVSQNSSVKDYDPFEELGLEHGASERKIRSAYRKLSLVYHPDKQDGNEEKFVRISKAYQALTDEVARENFEKYGNPDGPSPLQFGIGLPSILGDSNKTKYFVVGYLVALAIIVPLAMKYWTKSSDVERPMQQTYLWSYSQMPPANVMLKNIATVVAGSPELAQYPCTPNDEPWVDVLAKKGLTELTSECNRPLPEKLVQITGMPPANLKMNMAVLTSYLTRSSMDEFLSPEQATRAYSQLNYILESAPKAITAFTELCLNGQNKDHRPSNGSKGSKGTSPVGTNTTAEKAQSLSNQQRKRLEREKKKREAEREQQEQKYVRPEALIKATKFSQMLCQGLYLSETLSSNTASEETLKQIPAFAMNAKAMKAAIACLKAQSKKIEGSHLSALLRLPDASLDSALAAVPVDAQVETRRLIKSLPNLKVQASLGVDGEEEVMADDLMTLRVKIEHLNPVTTEEIMKINDSPDNLLIGSNDNDSHQEQADKVTTQRHGASFVDEDDEDVQDGQLYWTDNNKIDPLPRDSTVCMHTHTPAFPLEMPEKWTILLTDDEKNGIWALDKVFESTRVMRKSLRLKAPSVPGTYTYQLHIMSNSYIGLDHTTKLRVNVLPPQTIPKPTSTEEDEEDKVEYMEGTLEEAWANDAEHELVDDSDDDEEETEETPTEQGELAPESQEDVVSEKVEEVDEDSNPLLDSQMTPAQRRKLLKRLQKKKK